MEATSLLEQQRAHELAEEYRQKGYEVIEEPAPDQLPDFLAAYHPDLLLRRGEEAIVVAVKARSSLVREPHLRELARVLQAKPGWTFELVLVQEGERLAVPDGAQPFQRADIRGRLDTAARLLEVGAPEAAVVLAWGAAEASVRLLSEEEGVVLERLTPPYILYQAVTNGVISRGDYQQLLQALKYRNALVHGFTIPDFNPGLAQELINMTGRFLHFGVSPESGS